MSCGDGYLGCGLLGVDMIDMLGAGSFGVVMDDVVHPLLIFCPRKACPSRVRLCRLKS